MSLFWGTCSLRELLFIHGSMSPIECFFPWKAAMGRAKSHWAGLGTKRIQLLFELPSSSTCLTHHGQQKPASPSAQGSSHPDSVPCCPLACLAPNLDGACCFHWEILAPKCHWVLHHCHLRWLQTLPRSCEQSPYPKVRLRCPRLVLSFLGSSPHFFLILEYGALPVLRSLAHALCRQRRMGMRQPQQQLNRDGVSGTGLLSVTDAHLGSDCVHHGGILLGVCWDRSLLCLSGGISTTNWYTWTSSSPDFCILCSNSHNSCNLPFFLLFHILKDKMPGTRKEWLTVLYNQEQNLFCRIKCLSLFYCLNLWTWYYLWQQAAETLARYKVHSPHLQSYL